MARVLEIVMKARNEIGGAVKSVQADMDKLRESANKFNLAFNLGATVNIAKGAFVGLEAVIRGLKGDANAMVEALYRLPLGIGEAIRAAKSLWDVMTGVADKTKEAADHAARLKAAGSAADKTRDFWEGINLEKSVPPVKKLIEIESAFRKEMEAAGARGIERLEGSNILQMDSAYQAFLDEEAAIRDRYGKLRHIAKLSQEQQLNDLRTIGDKMRDEREKQVQDAVNSMNARAEAERVAFQNMAAERADAEREDWFRGWIEQMRPGTRSSGGSTGTISAVDIGSRFRGLAESNRNEASRLAQEANRKIDKTNELLNNMLTLDKENGGALRRFFSSIGPL